MPVEAASEFHNKEPPCLMLGAIRLQGVIARTARREVQYLGLPPLSVDTAGETLAEIPPLF